MKKITFWVTLFLLLAADFAIAQQPEHKLVHLSLSYDPKTV
jgi:hypothetical protein